MEPLNQQSNNDLPNLNIEVAALKAEIAELKRQKNLAESERETLLVRQNAKDCPDTQELLQKYQNDRERLKLAQKVGNVGTFEWFIEENRIIWTPELEALYGLPPGGFEGKLENWASRVHPEDLPKTEASLWGAVKGGPSYNVEFRVIWSNGTQRWMLAKGELFYDKQGNANRLIGVNIDITERKRWEERIHFLEKVSTELASSIDYETTIQQVVRLAVPFLADWCSLDLEDRTTRIIRRVATAHVNPAKEALAKQLLELYPYTPEQLDILKESLKVQKTLLRGEVSLEDLAAIARSPEHLQALVEIGLKSSMLVPLFSRGELIGAFTIGITESDRIYDESDVALAEEMARRVAMAVDNAILYRDAQLVIEKQKEIDRLKDGFLSIASHELRTPLTSLKGYTQMFQRNLVKKQPGERYEQTQLERERSMTEVMLHQIENMGSLINDMLDISRIEQGKLQLNYIHDVNLAELVEQVVEQQRIIDGEKHQLFVQSASPEFLVDCDPARLEQVLNNLVTNACKYSANGKPVIISIEQIEARAEDVAKSYVLISVRDEGVGISAEHLPHLFEQFYRVQSEGSNHIDGLGLGLYISKQIMQQHGGQLWAESQPGQGSTFYLCLPLTSEQIVK